MKSLYLILNFGSLLIPFLFSFHPKLKFYRYWKALFLSIIISSILFISWDIIFTLNGIWGFNSDYFIGTKLLSLPIEEWLFFICIPYACVFTHYALLHYFPNLGLRPKNSTIITHIIIAILLLLSFIYYDKWYTLVNFIVTIITLLLVRLFNSSILHSYYLTFLVMLIPFFIVNGILTGSFIDNEIVWYNNNENLNLRLFTIPIEDTVYAFSLILINLALTDFFYKRFSKQKLVN
ncbi:lycopene cyclase domain-containing protein [Ichthyenterobacterium magnum]|uniref:Lycopene cyclase domain-containing protein n=1 Tax=Ichthyenterobacterium magnum TaxID=1230530 RepID=A0A420DGF1_9FLAO|nr:lycopene cyclase domain-containing protein [Ichthyenterobacterium magnum]RKE92165.1 lycopene cyclase domain-containing protein [Ichthyenterobacterium magnum]